MDSAARHQEWQNARDLLLAGASTKSVISALYTLGQMDVAEMYEDNQTILHHAIARNCTDVIKAMFQLDCFSPFYQSNTMPYLHMACMYGHEEVVSLLLKYGRNELHLRVSVEDHWWKDFISARTLIQGTIEGLEARQALMMNEDKTISALEIAAVYMHRSCLIILLNASGISQEEWLKSIAETGLSTVMQNLLGSTDYNALNFDFKESLCSMSPKCLGRVLQKAADCNIQLTAYISLKNPYHFMYTRGTWNLESDPLQCTQILLHHGYDVNVLTEPCFVVDISPFAMYALISHVMQSCTDKRVNKELACLELLLKSGANPNYSESLGECNSAAKVLINTCMPRWHLGNAESFNIIHYTLRLLFEHGCDFSITDSDGMSVLHHAMYSVGCTFMFDHLSTEVLKGICKTVGMLVLYGADIQGKDRSRRNASPLVHFMEEMFSRLVSWSMTRSVVKRAHTIYRLIHVMELKEAHEVVDTSIDIIERPSCCFNRLVMPLELEEVLKQKLVLYLEQFRPLQQQCLIKVWRYCGHNLANFNKLELSAVLKDRFIEMCTCFAD